MEDCAHIHRIMETKLLLDGKIAFVTGAASGIGRSTCAILAREGARVVVADVNDAGSQETLSLLPDPARHLLLHVDVADEASVAAAVEAVQSHFGRPADVIVNCAGVLGDRVSVLDMELQELRRIHRINYEGTFLVMRAFVRALRDAEMPGSVINISSVGAKMCFQTGSHYCASKGAVSVLTKAAAKEWASIRVRCNAVLPGFVRTPMIRSLFAGAASKEFVPSYVPVQRLAAPEEIGEVIAFLASDRSSYVTGSEIPVSGGVC